MKDSSYQGTQRRKTQQLRGNQLQGFISSLDKGHACLLIVDTQRCPHSQRLVEEMRVSATLASHDPGKASMVHVLDLSDHPPPLFLENTMTWLPGVPCLLVASRVHLGVDAFNKCREMCRSDHGVMLQDLALLA